LHLVVSTGVPMSHSGASNPCDVAPSRFKRFERDGYFTLDADWIIPALCRAVQVEGPILDHAPAAATWFASCAHKVLLCVAPISTRTPIRLSLT
jgi:hypothetical protein